MTKEELFNTRQFLGVEDIMRLFDCCSNKARDIIRQIKVKSDRLHIIGKVTISDYEVWFNEGCK